MKIDEHISPRSRLLMFQTLELLRKEIQPKFADLKDADDWLFAQLDFTKGELAQVFKGRGVMYYDGSAVDPVNAIQEYEQTLEFAHDFGNGFQVLKVFATPDPLCGYGDIYSSKRDYDLFSDSCEPVVGYCVVDSTQHPVMSPDICNDFCPTVADAIADYKQSLRLPDLSLSARLVEFYKDFDFYDFIDKTELNQTEEDIIVDFDKQLNDPKSAATILESIRVLLHEGDLTPEQAAEAGKLIHDLGTLHSKVSSKVSLNDKIASAAGRSADAFSHNEPKAKDQQPDR